MVDSYLLVGRSVRNNLAIVCESYMVIVQLQGSVASCGETSSCIEMVERQSKTFPQFV